MSRARKIITWPLRGLLVFATLVVVAMVIAPRLTDLETVRSGVQEMFAQEIGGEINYRQIELSYFPRPHIIVYKTKISLSKTFTVNIHLLKIYPKIWPLLRGRIQPAIVNLEYADYFLALPQIGEKTIPADNSKSLDQAIKASIQAVRELPGFKMPEITVRIKNSKVNLTDPFGYTFKLRELNGSYEHSRKKIEFTFECKSNLWDKVIISATLNPLDFRGRGHVQCSEFRPQALFSYFFPGSEIQVIDSKADFNIDLESDEFGQVQAYFKGAAPRLEIRKDNDRLEIKGHRVEGTVRIDPQRASIVLADMGFDQPKLSLSGEVSYDQTRNELDLRIDADQIDVDSTRAMAIRLAGEIATIREIFNIIRGGTVPWMTVRAKGHTFNELSRLENIVIQGQMSAGKIFIPEARLDLEQVEGYADISKGILRGENLSARMGDSIGQMGTLALGLEEIGTPVNLNIQVAADLSQLIPVLKRLVKDQPFLTELDFIENFKGSAKGTLALSGASGNLSPRVEVSEVHLTARYRRIPYAIQIDGGYFFYEGSQLTFQNMDTLIGSSSMATLSSVMNWENTPTLKAEFKSAHLNLAELSPWLMSFKKIRERLQAFHSAGGKISFQHLNLEGPLFRPENWRPQTQGTVESIILEFNSQPKPLKIARGQFSWQESRILFTNTDATLGKSSVMQASGDFIWGAQFKFEAQSGPAVLHLEDISPWLFSVDQFPQALRSYQPLNGSLTFQRMALSRPISEKANQPWKLAADIETLTIHSERLPGPLQISRGELAWEHTHLALKNIDAELGSSKISRLSADLDWGNASRLDIRSESIQLFPAELYPWLAALEKWSPVFRELSASDGILGLHDLDLKGPLHHPADWEYRLTGQMQNLVLTSDIFGGAVVVSQGALAISKEISSGKSEIKIKLDPTSIVWGSNLMTITGEMNAAVKRILLNLDITADGIDWSQVKSVLDYIEREKAAPSRQAWEEYLEGTLNVQTDRFTYDAYRIDPLEAAVSFDPANVSIAVGKAGICGLSFQGRIKTDEQLWEIYFVPVAAGQDLGATLTCFTTEKDLATGSYDLNGELTAKTKPEVFPRSLFGNVVFSAENGRIHRFGLLAKIFAILNVTEVYRGEIPDLTGEGFAYSSMNVRAKIKEGKIIMEECAIDGASMGIACEGDIDIADKRMDLIILVAPFKTMDRIVAKIPMISTILDGRLISIPFSAKGNLEDPEVMPLPPTAVGSGVLGILERILKLPITIIQPVLPQKKDGNSE
jgi:hypothetical protein